MYFLGLFFPVAYSNYSKIISEELKTFAYTIKIEELSI
ncbi:hypothetical protein SAMN04489723_11616 [Algoriphagus aquimarinus]|uniref:Uncharacterized protein n=1 Tax=Algoriphagus aquimarinus TaxID=237018 RepID=A0A1I1BPD3_9BACT|nr:hypothetical protein SAMN04489723_11616 [Algoriphagus aquimarinus]